VWFDFFLTEPYETAEQSARRGVGLYGVLEFLVRAG
jgi:hypothetical protein